MARKTEAKQAAQGNRRTATAERTVEIGIKLAALIFFGLPLLYFLPALLPGRHIYGSDYIEAGYMMYEFARERIAAGELPKWVPYVMGGLPMFANPGSVFYPVRLLINLVLPGTYTLPLIFVLQFGLAGFGMYLLARELGCRTWVAFVAGLAFQFTGITMSAVHAGHDGRVIVATFAPLFLFFLHRGVRTGSLAAFAGVAATLGFALLSFQIQSNYYMLLAGMAWAIFALIHLGVIRTPQALAKRTAMGLGAVAFAFAIAAVNFLPFRDYVADSPRGAARGYDYSTTWSLPPADLVGVAVPEHTGLFEAYKGKNPFKLNTEYVGVLVLLMLVLGLAVSRKSKYWWFFFGLSVVTLTIAMGGHTPIYKFYYEYLPGTKRFRAPSVSFFVIALALAAMAALTLERLAQLRETKKPGRDTVSMIILGTMVAAIVITAMAGLTQGFGGAEGAAAGFGRFALFTIFTSLTLWFWWIKGIRTLGFVVLLSIITIADLVVVNRRFFSTVESPDKVFAVDGLINYLATAPGPNRVWIFPAAGANESNVLMLFDVQQAGGEHGNQLQRWNEYVGEGKTTYVDYHNLIEKSNFVNAANVKYLISRVDLKLTGADTLVMKERFRGGGFVYENLRALPRSYVVGQILATRDSLSALTHLADTAFDIKTTAVVYTDSAIEMPDVPLQATSEVEEYTPDRVVVRAHASRPAFLVLADNWHKDWRATVNGKPTRILRANHTFRGVPIGAGNNEVVFEFHPQALYNGFYIYLFCLTLLGGYAVWLLAARLRKR